MDIQKFQCRSDFWILLVIRIRALWIHWLSGLTKIVLTNRKLDGFVAVKLISRRFTTISRL